MSAADGKRLADHGARPTRCNKCTSQVVQRLRAVGHDVELVRIVTEGDVRPVDSTPGEGMFVTALASVLKRREIEIAAHSARDVPLEEDPELLTAAYPGIHSWPIWASRSTGSTKSESCTRSTRPITRTAANLLLGLWVSTRNRAAFSWRPDSLCLSQAVRCAWV